MTSYPIYTGFHNSNQGHQGYQTTYFYPQVQYVNEQDVLYRTSEGRTMQYQQPGARFKEDDDVIFDNIPGFNAYPFNTSPQANYITEVFMKLKDSQVSIRSSEIVSNKPVCIEITGSSLFIWNTETDENRLLTTGGDSVVDGYNLLCYDGSRKKVNYNFDYTKWFVKNLRVGSIEVRGNGSSLIFDQGVLGDNLNFRCYGGNTASFGGRRYNLLDIYTTNGNLDFADSNIDHLTAEMEGNGKIRGLKVLKSGRVKLVGTGSIYLEVAEGTEIEKKIFGTGSINIF